VGGSPGPAIRELWRVLAGELFREPQLAEIAHALLEIVDTGVDRGMGDDERERPDAALDHSITQSPDAGQ